MKQIKILKKVKSSILLSLIFFLPSSLWAQDSKNRVEELFIWKISDEMKLSVPEEKSFADLIRSLNQKRTRANDDLQSTLKKLAEAKTPKEKDKLLAAHRRQIKTYSDIAIEEVDKVEKLFGTDRTAQYFVLKNDLTNRLKMVLSAPEKPTQPAEKLGPPKVIEEK